MFCVIYPHDRTQPWLVSFNVVAYRTVGSSCHVLHRNSRQSRCSADSSIPGGTNVGGILLAVDCTDDDADGPLKSSDEAELLEPNPWGSRSPSGKEGL